MKIGESGSGSFSQRHGSVDPDRIRIRIPTKMSWIRNTAKNYLNLMKLSTSFVSAKTFIAS